MTIESEARWHLDKRLNIGHLLTTVSVAAAMFVWGANIESRISVLETQTQHAHEVQKEIKDELVRLNEKMDRLIERVNP